MRLQSHWARLALLTAAVGLLVAPAISTRAHADEDETAKAKESGDPESKNEAGKIAVFRLTKPVKETPGDDLFSFGESGESLKDLVARMDKAADDPAVKAVVVLVEGGSAGTAQVEEIRRAIAYVRVAGKEVHAHADSVSMLEFVLLSGASRLSVVPTADLWITGLHGESPYLRRLLDKVGVRPDFLTCGDYKSASEIFMREGPSPEAEKMQNWLLDSLFETYLTLIAEGRKLDPKVVRVLIDAAPYTAEKAKAIGLVDAVEHRGDFEEVLRSKFGEDVVFDKKYGKKEQPKPDFSSPFGILKFYGDLLGGATKTKDDKPAVGIVYVEGPIMLGRAESSPFGGEASAYSSAIRQALDEAAEDDAIEAVVLRVDSPGGSAVASEIILDATRRVREAKPLVVSMGNVAGSGGYYVACGSDVIFADAATITGSIGVVGGKLATGGLWDKLGIDFKGYQRGQNAGILASSDVFSEGERQKMQTWMDEIYGVFKGHVVAIRGDRLKKPIDELAGGRVYTGRQALELGLVDKIGTLEDAIAHAAKEAELEEGAYEVRAVPKPKNALEALLEEASGDADADRKGLDLAAGTLLSGSLADLALPYLRQLDPARASAVRMALRRLELIHREGASLSMPEISIGHR